MKLTKKRDLIGYKEINRFSRRIKKRHMSSYGQYPHDDENKYLLEETLMGMEYAMDPEMEEGPEKISEEEFELAAEDEEAMYREDEDLVAPI